MVGWGFAFGRGVVILLWTIVWAIVAGIIAVLITGGTRSEEHTSELQSQSNLVCRLLLEKKKTICRSLIYSFRCTSCAGSQRPRHPLGKLGRRLRLRRIPSHPLQPWRYD